MVWSDKDNIIPSNAFDGLHPTVVRVFCPDHKKYFNITYVRNYHLTSSESDLSTYSKTYNEIERPWIHLITNNTILLMNKGAHYKPIASYASQLNETFRNCIIEKKLVVFKDTHYGVIDYKSLFSSPPSRPNYPNFTSVQLNWGWNRFEEENILTKDLIRNSFNWVIYMNISGSTSYRSDSRRHGLHFCIPGTVDSWVMKFLEIVHIYNLKLKGL